MKKFLIEGVSLRIEGFMCTTLADVKELDQSLSLSDMAEV